MKKKTSKLLLQINRNSIREATESAELMIASGTLYKEHPIVNLINEILDEAVKSTQITIERKH